MIDWILLKKQIYINYWLAKAKKFATFKEEVLIVVLDSILTKKKYQCRDCIYSYNPAVGDQSQGIPPGTAFEDLPSNWVCPVCKVGKSRFKPYRV